MMRRKVIVEVCNAHNLMPKDGQGSSSPYVQVDFDGQRRKTTTKIRDLNPVWNELLEFWVSDPMGMSEECVEATIYNDRKISARRSNFLGKVSVSGSTIVRRGEETVMYYPLEKRGLFSHIKGDLGLKICYVDEEAPPPEVMPPPPPPVETARPPPPPTETAPPPTESAPPPTEPAPLLTEPASPPAPPPPLLPTSVQYHRPPPHTHHATPPADLFPVRHTFPSLGEKAVTYDLVEKMHYLFVRVVKARHLAAKDLTGSSDPYVQIVVGNHVARSHTVRQNLNPEWHEVFAFAGSEGLAASTLEVGVWDADVATPDDFLGAVLFDLHEVPRRVLPDSPLAPEWYKLDRLRPDQGGRVSGDIMLAVWVGTQADEAFPEAWQSDTGGRHSHTRSKVYMSPKLWYLRAIVIEAQDLQTTEKSRYPETSVRLQMGFQNPRTRAARNRTTSPVWNEELMLVAAEPFEERVVVYVLDHIGPDHDETLGVASIELNTIERRIDYRQITTSRWFNLEKTDVDQTMFRGRIHLRLCLEGGYHVMDETAHLSSDFRPTFRQLWGPALGVLEVGILGSHGLLPMKTRDGRGITDAFVVAKYGNKWVRTRTILDNFSPRWNEQYTWEVYDPCTVLTIGVFDNAHVYNNSPPEHKPARKETRIGKVRIRLSTLETDRIYTNSYPLLFLHPSGPKKMGELELAVRFSTSSLLSLLHTYSQPLFPHMHYIRPIGVALQETLRLTAMHMVALRLSRSEPPLRSEVVRYMLDTTSTHWSIRRCKANWFRIMSVLTGMVSMATWLNDICHWRNTMTTVLVHILFVILVCYPELILPTLFLYMFLIGAWHYRFRPRSPSHMDARLSYADAVTYDDLNEEFDTIPSSSPPEFIRHRYERLRDLGSRIQTVLGDLASQGERIQSLLSWRDPRATAIFITFCLLAALVLYVSPIRLVLLSFGIYYLRHPRFREHKPPLVFNFFRRLPTLSERIL